MKYQQVLLRSKETNSYTTCWIPSKLAKKGKLLTIKDADVDNFDPPLWEVMAAYSLKIDPLDIYREWKVGGLTGR